MGRRVCGLLAGLCLMLGATLPATAQQTDVYTLIVRDVPVVEALEAVVSTTGIDLLYGAEVEERTRGQRVFCRVEEKSAEEVLGCVVRSVGLDFYRLSSGTYVVIAASEEAPAYGTLVGVVTDRRSGTALPHARIRMADQPAAVQANGAGLFSLPRLLPGPHTVSISAVGYRPMTTTVEVGSSGDSRLVFSLEPQPFRTLPVVVDGIASVASALTGSGGTAVPSASLLADLQSSGDFRRGLPRILGVSRRPLSSEILIQGGDVTEQKVRLDGAPVYNPLTVEGLMGTFSPLSLERVTVRKAGFPVRHGSAASGILDFEHLTAPRGAAPLELQVDRFNANARLLVPVQGRGGGTGALMIAWRTALWGVFPPSDLQETLRSWNRVDPLLTAALQGEGPGLPARSEAVEYRYRSHDSRLSSDDLHLASRVPLGPGRWVGVSAYRGTNEISTGLEAAGHHESAPRPDRIMEAGDLHRWRNSMATARYEGLLGSRGTLSVQLHGSRHRFRSGYGMVLRGVESSGAPEASSRPVLSNASAMTEAGGSGTVEYSLGPGHRLLGGVEIARTNGRLEVEEGLLPDLRTRGEHTRVTLLVEDRWSRGDVTLEAGLRGSWLSGSPSLHWEPRAAVEVEGGAGLLGEVSVRLAAGLYRQFVHQMELVSLGPSALVPTVRFWLPAVESALPSAARHWSLEAVATPVQGWELRGEVFHRRTSDLPVVDYPSFLPADAPPGTVEPGRLLEPASARASGFGLRVAWAEGRVRTEAGYDFTHARRTIPSRFEGRAVPDPGSAPHRLLLEGEVSVTSALSIRLRSEASVGRGWAFRRAYYDLLTLHDERSELGVGDPGDRTLPALLETDLSATWSGSLSGWRVEAGAGVLNLFDRRNVLDYSLVRTTDAGSDFELLPRHLGGRSATLSVRVSL